MGIYSVLHVTNLSELDKLTQKWKQLCGARIHNFQKCKKETPLVFLWNGNEEIDLKWPRHMRLYTALSVWLIPYTHA